MKDDKDPESTHGPEISMTCRELFERLSEYLDGELPEDMCREIRQHIQGCDPCVAFARTLKTTAELCRRLPSQPVPPEVAAELRSFLVRHLPPAK